MFQLNFDQVSSLASNVIAAQSSLISEIESSNLFQIGYNKDLFLNSKRSALTTAPKIVVVTNPTNYFHFSDTINGEKVVRIPDIYLKETDLDTIKSDSRLQNSIVILTNNNVSNIGLRKYAEIYANLSKSFFAIHDFDNHHWHELSFFLAAYSDTYVPAHQSSHSVAGRINSNVASNIPCGSIQWSKEFLIDNINKILFTERTNDPLGMHFYYPKFNYRNSVLSTLSKFSKYTGLRDHVQNNFHALSNEDRLNEWVKHKYHWIVPVQNDLPIRFFDALITGGTPLVPSSLVSYLDNLGISKDMYKLYHFSDIVNPTVLIDSFSKELSRDSIFANFSNIIENYHIDAIINKIAIVTHSTISNNS